MMFLVLMSLSPVLRTLTAATSSDSIWALAALLFVLNALLADYTANVSEDEINEGLSSVLSMNAAVSASVVLASRLSTNVSVFALVLFSILSFALFPILRRRLQSSCSNAVWLLITAGFWISAVLLVANLSRTVMWIYFSILFFVTLIAPALLIWAQRYKNIIRGPWDVAVPKVK
jgi:phosphatidylinositol glycan class C protein